MKQLFSVALIATICTTMAFSCGKDHARKGNDVKNITLNVTQAVNATYTLDLSAYGDADDLNVIATQASHFATSAITKDATTGKFTYTYNSLPLTHFAVAPTDVVVLKITESATGRCHDKEETNITINFNLQ